MRIVVIGTRGIPGAHGGVERHCEQLYPRLAALGAEVCVYGRRGYVDEVSEFMGVEVRISWAPRGRGMEALGHTASAMLDARRREFDILHIHSVGPNALVPFARLLGFSRIVSTLHAPDYLQAKWGRPARALLRFGERQAALHTEACVSVSRWYAEQLRERLGSCAHVIPNAPGRLPEPRNTTAVLDRLGVGEETYVLFVGRLVPDKRVEDLVEATRSMQGRIRVVIAGDTSDTESYARYLRSIAHEGVVFAGYVYGEDLSTLYAGASVVVLPSAAEGMPLVLLEAMQLGVPVVAADIIANREIVEHMVSGVLYPVGDVAALESVLERLLRDPSERGRLGEAGRACILRDFSWDRIAADTMALYERLMGEHTSGGGRRGSSAAC